MSPEQACGTKGLDQRTDLYSLGCIIFHMLTGTVPFFAEDAVEVMLKHNEAERPDPQEIIPELHTESSRLVKWLMSVDPEKRPESAAVLLVEIEKLLPKLPEPAASARSIINVKPS
jgi:eukaryotic-like serine/threonine-protein kinase